jgi:hypothetical protein
MTHESLLCPSPTPSTTTTTTTTANPPLTLTNFRATTHRVLFRERNNTLLSFQREVENNMRLGFRYLNFNLGQYLTVIGGNLFLQGCA